MTYAVAISHDYVLAVQQFLRSFRTDPFQPKLYTMAIIDLFCAATGQNFWKITKKINKMLGRNNQ